MWIVGSSWGLPSTGNAGEEAVVVVEGGGGGGGGAVEDDEVGSCSMSSPEKENAKDIVEMSVTESRCPGVGASGLLGLLW